MPATVKLTPKQAELLKFLRSEIKRTGIPPTRQEIATHFGVWPFTITSSLKILDRKGAIELTPEVARGIRVL